MKARKSSILKEVKSEQELVELMIQEPDWDVLKDKNFVDKLFHLNGHHNIVNKLQPKSIEQLAAVLAIIRPAKRQLMYKQWNEIMKDVWVNGGFFVLEPQVFEYIENDSTIWEKEPMEGLVKNNQLSAYKHSGFYQHMDTIKEKNW